ncbi:hypothetical protein pipiens_018874, partial [Culex pipiens pipiens]
MSAASTLNISKNTILCHACAGDVNDEYVPCQGFCNAVFHLNCSGVKTELLKEIAAHRQIFWLCRSCTTLMTDLRHRRSVQCAFEAGQELSLSHHNRIVEQLKSEILLDLNDSFIQFGDYNQPGLKWIPSEEGGLEIDPVLSSIPLASSYLIDGFNLHGLTQLNSCINVHNNCLDLVLVNDVVLPKCAVFEAVEPLVPLDIAHPALEMVVDVPAPTVTTEPPSTIQQPFNFRKANYAAIKEELSY